ncbi:PAP2 superfamily-domain-containing protein [Xylaria arbuscula]|nr:PAP2 superfamily-domain-containing protein [Xylaria arbuscula]
MDQEPSRPDPARSSNIPNTAGSPLNRSSADSGARKVSSALSTRANYSIEKRPTFGQWIKVAWLDLLTLLVVGAFAFPIYLLANPIGIRVFLLDAQQDRNSSTTTSGIPPDLAYPARARMVSNWLIALIAIAFPTVVMVLMQFWVRNFWDLNNGLLGFGYTLLTSAAFQSTVKAFIGGLRPNFYDICQPDSDKARDKGNKTGLNGIGFRKDIWTKDVCTTTDAAKLRNAMQGFPSGHSTTMVAAMVYLCLYLNAKLKVFANYHTPLWKLIALTLPILGAVLLCGTLVIDNTHSWYDIVSGATIGALISFASFRMVYPSIFDWRINHIPLNRNTPFDGQSRQDLVATTRAGWRSPMMEDDSASVPEARHDGLEGDHGAGPSNPNRTTMSLQE